MPYQFKKHWNKMRGQFILGEEKNSKGYIPHSIAFHAAFQDTI